MDDIKFGEDDIGGYGGGKMALIDSGNTSIQMPASQFSQLKTLMKRKDSSIYSKMIEEKEILISRKLCSDLYNILDDLKFSL